MVFTLLIIFWVLLGTMTASALFFKNYQNHQVLGVTLSKAHLKTDEVQKILKKFETACLMQLFIFSAASLLMLWKPIMSNVDLYMLAITIVLIFTTGALIKIHQDKLRSIKEANNWTYTTNATVLVDTDASKEKGRSAVSVLWSWAFFVLSFIPAIFLFLNKDTHNNFPVGFALLGPVCQLFSILSYRQALNRRLPVISTNSEINKAFARTEERVHSMAATLAGFFILLFWTTFSFCVAYRKIEFASTYAITGLVIALISIAYWQQKKSRQAEEHFLKNSQELLSDIEPGQDNGNIYEQANLWKWGMFYNNPDDARLFVPKRVASMGWTINVARPLGKILMYGTLFLVLGILVLTFASSVTDYSISEKNSQITVSGVMYHSTFDTDDIVSVEKITSIPSASRTNGYGGASKSYGHFQVDGYGACMFYIYNDVKEYIVIRLEGDSAKYIFVNDKTPEATDKLFDYLESFK